ncbi:SANT and BTB domain regulator of class switch recombination-like [Tubulanus polymorphus]|uniref:SANT and BTB domain regulator of class switch recombination-like n=1 Tax=Tubulanus polymorphus TaxID=672921 RepID=UPI003DA41553
MSLASGGVGGPSALDLILKAFMNSRDFTDIKNKNWEVICRLVPGTSPRQVAKRYEELQQLNINQYSGDFNISSAAIVTRPLTLQGKIAQHDTDATARGEPKLSRPGSAKQKTTGQKSERTNTTPSSTKTRSGSATSDQGPVMVIHVCDEAKNLKQDFHCPRDLLVREMQYFAEYLSTDAHRWEEVDISVHCDVLIFDWLMKYVKRNDAKATDPVSLEPNNVISILISSDFLKMDSLVEKCIEYCHKNLNAIVATPCNMNCINDSLVSRIANLFNHNELDEVRDRKDKFKSKLFAKKIERLFDGETMNHCSPENACTLYKCSMCQKLCTFNLQSKLNCVESRMTIDCHGNLIYTHLRDTKWNVNDHLLEWMKELKTWRDLYWRLWGTVNYLSCSCCGEVFPCAELGHCKFHPNDPIFPSTGDKGPAIQGKYPCCGQKTLRFDPLKPNTGCQTRDHIVHIDKDDPHYQVKNKVYEDLLLHREAITVLYVQPIIQSTNDKLNIFAKEEAVIELQSGQEKKDAVPKLSQGASKSSTSETIKVKQVTQAPQPRLHPLTVDRSFENEFGFGESDDEIGDDEVPPFSGKLRKPRAHKKSRVTVDPQAILLDAPDFRKNSKWDANKSHRWNQDSQREEDHQRMKEIISYLTKLRLNNERLDKMKQKEYAGGIYCKLEAQWKMSNIASRTPLGQLRNKPRLGQVRNSIT